MYCRERVPDNDSGDEDITTKILRQISADDHVNTGINAKCLFAEVASTWKKLNWSKLNSKQSIEFGIKLLERCQVRTTLIYAHSLQYNSTKSVNASSVIGKVAR